jgi:hypothetical protein
MKINNRWKKIQTTSGIYLPTLPKIDLINKNTKVCLMGSCFADEMGWVLKNENIDIGDVEYNNEMKHVSYPWGTFFTPMNLFDVLDALMNNKTKNIFNEESFIRVPKNLEGNHYQSLKQYDVMNDYNLWCLFIKARLNTASLDQAISKVDSVLSKLNDSLKNADVVIITLGLIETWINKVKNFAWHSFHGDALTKKSIDDLAYFKQLNFEEVTNYIQKIINIINNIGNKKIIFTVSPIPLNFTFTNNDIVIANKYSKSVLRSAIDGFIDNKNVFYFPSFEIIQDCVGWPNSFKDDKRHVKIEVFKDFIGPTFIKSFTSL